MTCDAAGDDAAAGTAAVTTPTIDADLLGFPGVARLAADLDADLGTLIGDWPDLPAATRAAVLAVVAAAR